jgi:hypothetical protein
VCEVLDISVSACWCYISLLYTKTTCYVKNNEDMTLSSNTSVTISVHYLIVLLDVCDYCSVAAVVEYK